MKKKLFTVAAVLALAAVMGASVLAAPGQGRYYTDADGDGVCDNRSAQVCPYPGGSCGAFVDEDNDGICDRQQSLCPWNGQRPMDGTGRQNGLRGGRNAG